MTYRKGIWEEPPNKGNVRFWPIAVITRLGILTSVTGTYSKNQLSFFRMRVTIPCLKLTASDDSQIARFTLIVTILLRIGFQE